MSTDASTPRRRPGRPRGQDSSVVREAVLGAAIELIAEHGYSATSMAQVAEAAGISPSGLVHHFPSKAALLGAVLDRRDELDTITREADPEVPWDVLDRLVLLAAENMRHRQLVALYMSVIGEAVHPAHPAHAWMLRHYAEVLALIVTCVEHGQRSGAIREDAPAERIARGTVALMDGLQVQWLLDPTIDMSAEMGAHVDGLKQLWGTGPAGLADEPAPAA